MADLTEVLKNYTYLNFCNSLMSKGKLQLGHFMHLIKPFRMQYNLKQQLDERQRNIWPLCGYDSKANSKAS